LAVAVAESGFPRSIGARVELESGGLPAECVLFGEDASRVLISCTPENTERIQQISVEYGVAALSIGATSPQNVDIVLDGKMVVSAPVSELKQAWESALTRALHAETEERLVPEILQKS
jgi:phosphoribosylformylglycinamidine synthase